MINKIKTLENINTINMYGTGNKELDNEVKLYISLLNSREKKIIKFYWYGENKRTVKYQFNMKYSDYLNVSDKLIKGVNGVIDKYYDNRTKAIEKANKEHRNIVDLFNYSNMRKNKIVGGDM